ncbi:MAG TPA: pilus assembly protein PilP [Candidatus Tenderia sp.]|nr:pilus assembly protein PilP [Candidatus Tenderia sp.]
MTQGIASRILNGAKGAVLLFVAVTLVGCADSDVEDLRAFVAKVKSSKQGRVEPLPEFVPTASFRYSAAGMDDPFMSWELKRARQQAAQREEEEVEVSNGLSPDVRRRREPLESYPLDTLRMVGTMTREGEQVVLVKSPDGLISRVSPGNYLGQNHGKVVAIKEDRIELVEIVPDGLGGWLERPASLALVE